MQIWYEIKITTSTCEVWVSSSTLCWITYGYYREKFHVNHFWEFKGSAIQPCFKSCCPFSKWLITWYIYNRGIWVGRFLSFFFFHSAPVYRTQANLTVTPLIQTLHYQMQHNLQNISQLSLLILRGYQKIFISLARSWSYNLY